MWNISSPSLTEKDTRSWKTKENVTNTELCEHLYVNAIVQLGQCHKRTWVMGKAPALSSGSACKMDRKVSVPSNPSPARNACITGMTDSSRSSHWTRPSRYVSRKRLHWEISWSFTTPNHSKKLKEINCYYSAKMHWFKSDYKGIYNATKDFDFSFYLRKII